MGEEHKDFSRCYITKKRVENAETGKWLVVGDRVGLINLLSSWIEFHDKNPGKMNKEEIKFTKKLFIFLKED